MRNSIFIYALEFALLSVKENLTISTTARKLVFDGVQVGGVRPQSPQRSWRAAFCSSGFQSLPFVILDSIVSFLVLHEYLALFHYFFTSFGFGFKLIFFRTFLLFVSRDLGQIFWYAFVNKINYNLSLVTSQ